MGNTGNKREILVYADWDQMTEPMLMGTLRSKLTRGKEIFSFEYTREWLLSPYVQILDPDLRLYAGTQFLYNERKANFGIFLDSSPDRWGRLLMRRREAALARQEGRTERQLFETDYLMGVYDNHRMGGLRFKYESDGPFLNDNREMATPPWTSIRELEEISLKLEEEDIQDDPRYFKWLSMLVAPGSSLGGARPKASIVDTSQNLWIAKFPSRNDLFDTGGWEKVSNELAIKAGINAAESMAGKFSSRYHTYLTKRFDRNALGNRIHFASAMTLLGHIDFDDPNPGASYLELAGFIMTNGARVDQDLEELWRRIVFNICISNTDDHLRNHGFILTPKGWIISPAYDMNPDETGTGLRLNINETENSLDLDLALEVCEYFGLDLPKAKDIINDVKSSVSKWENTASEHHIPKSEQELKALAFRRIK